MSALTTQDKVRRTVIALIVVACAIGVGLAVNSTREVDANGDPVLDAADPCDVDVSGDLPSGDGEALPECDPQDEDSPEIVEQLFPRRDSEELQQVQVGVDLGPRYQGTLFVGGTEVPEDQLVREPALNQVFFSPGEGRVIEEWSPGRNCVRAEYWLIAEGRSGESNGDVEWCFEVT